MFENLTYEKFKKTDTGKMTSENYNAMIATMAQAKNDLLKGRKMNLADGKALAEKNEEIRKEYETKLKDRIAKSNASIIAYRQMWNGVRSAIEKDPVLKAYREKNQLSTIQALNQLSGKYGHETALGKQLKSMERMVTALDGICEIDQTKEDFVIDQSGKNLMKIFLTELNNTNGKTMGREETKKSLSEEAYDQLESTQYDGVEKNQDLLLPVHLGQICSDLVTQVAKIEATAPLLHGEDELMKREILKNDYESFVSKFPVNPEEFFSKKEQEIAKLGESVAEYDSFKKNKTGNLKEIQEKYKDYLAKETAKLSANEIKQIYDAEIEKREKNLRKFYQNEIVKNKSTESLNEDMKRQYEENLEYNKKIRESINEVEKDKDRVLGDLELQIRKSEEADNQYRKERETEGNELEQQWKDYDKKLTEAQKELKGMEEALAERSKLEAEISRLAPKGNELGDLTTSRRMLRTFQEIIVGIERGINGDASVSNGIGNAALRSKDLTAEDILNAPEHLRDNIIKTINVQATWKDFKQNHSEYSSFFHYVDDYKGVDGSSREHGPMDELYDQFELWKKKTAQLEKVLAPYLSAKKKVEDLSKQNDGRFVTEEEVEKKRKEVAQLTEKTPTKTRFNRKEWDKETESGLGSETAGLKKKRREEERGYDAQIQSYKEKLKNESEPVYFSIKTEEEIKKSVEKEREKILGKAVCEKLNVAITRKVSDTKKDKAMASLEKSLEDKAHNASSAINNINSISKKIDDMFKADKERMEKNRQFTDGLKARVTEFRNKKRTVYGCIRNDLSNYFGNMEKGKKKGHNNSDEFTAMSDSVKAAVEMFDPEKKHTVAEQLKALNDMKEKADFYKDKKEHDFHVDFFASSMRHVRLNMASDLSRFAEEKIKQISAFEKYSDGLQKHLETFAPKASVFDVKPGDVDAASHFKRIFKAKQQEKQLEASRENLMEKGKEKTYRKDDTEVKKSDTAVKLGGI